MKDIIKELKIFLVLWSTQSLSQLGSAMTNFALTLWLYQQTGSAPRDRVRVIYVTMLISLGTENFLLAFSRTPALWCLGQVIGWLPVPVMNANLDVILRSTIPEAMQGRVYSCRNTLQFFTIPVGFFLGGYLVDGVCEPVMRAASPDGLLTMLFGSGKGSGAAMVMMLLGVTGTGICLIFGRILRKYHFEEGA